MFQVGRLRSFQNHCRVSSLDSFVLDNWMWKFLMAQSAVLDGNRGPKNGPPRGPFVRIEEMSNDLWLKVHFLGCWIKSRLPKTD
jgi:hypothetical protein